MGRREPENVRTNGSPASVPEDSQGGGFPCAVATKEGSDLVLIEGDVEPVHSGPAVGLKHLHQVLHTHPGDQAWQLTFEEGVSEEKVNRR